MTWCEKTFAPFASAHNHIRQLMSRRYCTCKETYIYAHAFEKATMNMRGVWPQQQEHCENVATSEIVCLHIYIYQQQQLHRNSIALTSIMDIFLCRDFRNMFLRLHSHQTERKWQKEPWYGCSVKMSKHFHIIANAWTVMGFVSKKSFATDANEWKFWKNFLINHLLNQSQASHKPSLVCESKRTDGELKRNLETWMSTSVLLLLLLRLPLKFIAYPIFMNTRGLYICGARVLSVCNR